MENILGEILYFQLTVDSTCCANDKIKSTKIRSCLLPLKEKKEKW